MSEIMLVKVNTQENNNKFYHLHLDGDTVHARWGRVGNTGRTKPYPGGQHTFDRLVRSKTREGYSEVKTVTAQAAKTSDDTPLKSLARKGLASVSDPSVVALIDRLVASNAHQIANISGGRMTVRDGQVTTPLGLVTTRTIDDAAVLLNELPKLTGSARIENLERYLRLIPQQVGARRGWHEDFLVTPDQVAAQADFLDRLRASVQVGLVKEEAGADIDPLALFRYRLAPVSDGKVMDDLRRRFTSTVKAQHSARVTGAKLVGAYEITDTRKADQFDALAAKLGNVQRNWHGTRNHNVLSILTTGFVPRGSISTVGLAGNMFGDYNCVYTSETSTKAAGYAAGGVWSSGVDRQWFMFSADVIMGNECLPDRKGQYVWDDILRGKVSDTKGRRFDSIHVRAGTCNVLNQEVITPIDQVALRYLVAFDS